MDVRSFARAGSVALGALLFASQGFAQTPQQPTSGKVGSMEWTLVGAGAGRGAAGPGGFPGGGRQGQGGGAGARGGAGGFPGGGGRGRGGATMEHCTEDAAK